MSSSAAGESAGDASAAAEGAAAPSEMPAPTTEFEKTWLQQKRERTEQLKKLREQEKSALKETGKEGSRQRLAYLMKMSDVFAHFASSSGTAAAAAAGAGAGAGSSSDAAPSTSATGGAGRKGRGRMTEKQEDEMMLKAHGGEEGDAKAPGKPEGGATRLTVQPPCIAHGKMRAYQLEGLNWMIKLHEHGINGILADEMGLGKTLQTISLLGYLKESRGISGPHLIITPKSTLTNWANECARWCPLLKVIRLQGDKATRAKIRAAHFDVADDFDVCLTTYESVIQEKAAIEKLVWRYVIIDEAHRIKNPDPNPNPNPNPNP